MQTPALRSPDDDHPSFVIGIAGGTGAGRTTVAREIAEAVGDAVTRIPVDNYYEDLSHMVFEERASVNYDHPSAFEWPLLKEQLNALLAGQSVEMPQYDLTEHVRRDDTITVEPTKKRADLVIPEGANDVAVTLLGEKVQAEAAGTVAELVADRNELERELDG